MNSRSRRLSLPGSAWLLALALFALCLGLQGSAAAQAPDLTISQATLRLWPEYDDPGLLVIFSGVFTGTASFPQQVAFPIPAAARGIQATTVDANGDLLNQTWQSADGKLVYTLPGPEFQIEFYLDRPSLTAAERELAYTFESSYAIKSLEVAAQQPARSSAFSIAPEPARSTQGSDGFTYYLIERSGIAAGEKIPFTLRYTKSDQGLSVAQAKVDAGQPLTTASATTPTAPRLQELLPFFLIGLGVVALIAAGIYAFLQRRSEPGPSAAPVSPRKPGGERAPSAAPPAAARAGFCTQCGRPLNPDDRFCARCGTPRRD